MQKIYLFGQSLSNTGADDWYEHIPNQETFPIDASKNTAVGDLLANITGDGQSFYINQVKCFYLVKPNHIFDIVLMIDNHQEDVIGRATKTALIIENFKETNFNIKNALCDFWKATQRNQLNVQDLSDGCYRALEALRKKTSRPKILTPLMVGILLAFIMILLLLILVLKK